MFFLILLVLVIISVFLAYRSLKHLQRIEEVVHVKKELTKGRVVYQNDSPLSS